MFVWLRDAAAVFVDALSQGAGVAAAGAGGPWQAGEGRCPAAAAAGMGRVGGAGGAGCGAPSPFNFDSAADGGALTAGAAAALGQGRLACHVVVQLTLLACGLAVPLLCGWALECTLRRRYAARLRAGSSGSGGSSRRSPGALHSEEWDCAAAPGRLALDSGKASPVAVMFVALSAFLLAWALVHAVAQHL